MERLIPDLDATILQAILAIPVALVAFAGLVIFALMAWERRQ